MPMYKLVKGRLGCSYRIGEYSHGTHDDYFVVRIRV